MKIAVISIGNEILNGSIIDTNSNYIAKTFAFYGYDVDTVISLRDDIRQIVNVFSRLSRECDIIVTTGGLGPTFDDRTTEALAKACKTEMKLNRDVYIDIVKKVKDKGIKLKLSHINQAYLPKGCSVIKNDYGTAPGMLRKINRAYFILMPGVPSEMKPMFRNYILPFIFDMFPVEKKFRYDLKLIGVAESDMDKLLAQINTKGVDIILNAHEGELAVRVFSYDKDRLDEIYSAVFDEFADMLYSKNGENIEDVVDGMLSKMNLKLGIVEGFSGGYLSLLMFDKDSFAGSIVTKKDDVDEVPRIQDANIVIYPNTLKGNNFIVNIYFKEESNQIYTKYMGNRNFIKKSVSKRTLGHLYEFLKNLDFL